MDFRIVREEKQEVYEAIDLSQRLLRANLVMSSFLPAKKKNAYEEFCPSRCHRTRLVNVVADHPLSDTCPPSTSVKLVSVLLLGAWIK